MGLNRSNAPLLDDCPQINITFLKRRGYIVPGESKSGHIRWGNNSVAFTVWFDGEAGYMELNYQYGNENVSYQIPIITRRSNLGTGRLLFFECAMTAKHCRKLYRSGKYFLHRQAYPTALYEVQTRSKLYRAIGRALDGGTLPRRKPYFKPFYQGEPTRRLQAIARKIAAKGRYTEQDIISMYQ